MTRKEGRKEGREVVVEHLTEQYQTMFMHRRVLLRTARPLPKSAVKYTLRSVDVSAPVTPLAIRRVSQIGRRKTWSAK